MGARAVTGPLRPWGVVPLVLMGCATASPMLAPARVLRSNKLELDVGSAYQAPALAPALTQSRGATATDEDRLRAAALFGVTPPGVVPYVAGRTGFGDRNEGSIALIGRVLRIGARREFVRRGDFSLTSGLNARLAFLSGDPAGAVPRVEVIESRLYGGEATLQVGITRQDIYQLWAGVRAGYLYGDSQLALGSNTGSTVPYAFASHRIELGANVGLRVGFGRIAVAAEVELGYALGFASAAPTNGDTVRTGSAHVLTVVPAGAVSYRF